MTHQFLKPPPEQEAFEREIRLLFDDGDITNLARFLRKDRSTVSKSLNPDVPERKSTFFCTIENLWALDAMGKGQADRVQSVMTRHRSLWLPAPMVRTDPAKTTSKIGREVMDLVEKELTGCSDEDLLKEVLDIKDAVNEKIDEVLAKREGRRLRDVRIH